MENSDYRLYEIYVKKNEGNTNEDIVAKLEFAQTRQQIVDAMFPPDEYLTILN